MPATGTTYTMTDGKVRIEAEDRTADYLTWTENADSDATGGVALSATGESSTWGHASAAYVDFDIDFPSSGTYYVWLLGKRPNTSDNTYLVGFNGSLSGGYLVNSDIYAWQGVTFTGGRTISVPSAGVHTVRVQNREAGALLDAIYVTDDANDHPTEEIAGAGRYQESAGLLCVEAESYARDTARFSTLSDAGAGGGEYVSLDDVVEPAAGSPVGIFHDYFEIDFNLATAGTYYIWVRMKERTAGDDTLFVSVDGTFTGGYLNPDPTWDWEGSVFTGSNSVVLSAGDHTIRISAREIAVDVDRIVLTTDSGYDPSTVNSGIGPAESPLVSSGPSLAGIRQGGAMGKPSLAGIRQGTNRLGVA